jgi:hypothetical protein
MDVYKLKSKIGVHEFDAEGPVDVVRGDYADFLAVVRGTKDAPVADAPAADTSAGSKNGGKVTEEKPAAAVSGANGDEPTDADMAKVFVARGADKLTLARLPQTEDVNTDAVVMLLYGFHRLRKEDNVLGTRVAEGLRLSGVSFSKLFRVMDATSQYTHGAGAGRGVTYGLKNPGIERAKMLVRTVAQ